VNRYDDRARLVFHFAREESHRLGHAFVGPEHLLLGIMREGGETANVLAGFGITLGAMRLQVETLIGRGDGISPNETATITRELEE
jgi:ATP-dependent Clp protease ATP-binding subunit ClpC